MQRGITLFLSRPLSLTSATSKPTFATPIPTHVTPSPSKSHPCALSSFLSIVSLHFFSFFANDECLTRPLVATFPVHPLFLLSNSPRLRVRCFTSLTRVAILNSRSITNHASSSSSGNVSRSRCNRRARPMAAAVSLRICQVMYLHEESSFSHDSTATIFYSICSFLSCR